MPGSLKAARSRRRRAELAAGARAQALPGRVLPRLPARPGDLRALSARLLAAFSVTGLLVWDWDVESGKVLLMSSDQPLTGEPPVVRLISADEWFDSTHPDDTVMAAEAVNRVLRGEADDFSTLYRRKRGEEWLYVETRGRVIERHPDGRPRRVVGTARNITAAVAEEKGRQVREASLRHRHLRAALTEFASGLAHELNQPLAALSGNVQAALRLLPEGSRVGPDALEALRASVLLAERAAEIVKGMRHLVRKDGGPDESFDLRALVRDVCEHLGPEARRAEVALHPDERKRPVPVTADRVQIEQVLVNLVRNGIEAITEASTTRRVAVAVWPGPRSVSVEVRDSGPGIPKEVRDRLFEPYVTTKRDGTGLGLRLCRSIAEAHGGRLVCAEAAPGRGTLFILELPSGAETAEQAASTPRAKGAARRRAPRG